MVVLFVFFVLLATSTGLPIENVFNETLQSRVMGGSGVQGNDLPYVVSIQERKDLTNTSHKCGGAILNQRWVLTAAHCVVRVKISDLFVRAGSKQVTGGHLYSVYRTLVYPYFVEASRANDIAIVQTLNTILYNTYVKPISISPYVQYDTNAVVAGWGKTKTNGKNANPVLQKMTTRTLLNSVCKSKYRIHSALYSKIYETNICAQSNGKRICVGDTGAPLIASGQLIGVASWSMGCADGSPDVFTRADKYRAWILQYTVV